jgi:hypothetical protein
MRIAVVLALMMLFGAPSAWAGKLPLKECRRQVFQEMQGVWQTCGALAEAGRSFPDCELTDDRLSAVIAKRMGCNPGAYVGVRPAKRLVAPTFIGKRRPRLQSPPAPLPPAANDYLLPSVVVQKTAVPWMPTACAADDRFVFDGVPTICIAILDTYPSKAALPIILPLTADVYFMAPFRAPDLIEALVLKDAGLTLAFTPGGWDWPTMRDTPLPLGDAPQKPAAPFDGRIDYDRYAREAARNRTLLECITKPWLEGLTCAGEADCTAKADERMKLRDRICFNR